MATEASLVKYYADRAREYERIYDKPERQAELHYLREWVEGFFAGTRVFEVACGTGYWTEVVARSAVTVVATDINEEVLAIARSKPITNNRVSFRQEDAYQLPVELGESTGALAAFWWSHIPRAKWRSFLQGFHRILAKDARVLFIDNTYVPGSSTPISHTDQQGDTFQVRRLEDGSIHEVLKNFPSDADLHAAVDGLGKQVHLTRLRHYWILNYVPIG